MINCTGVIGLGSISARHRKNIRRLLPDSKIIALSASGREVNENITDCDHLAQSIAELIEIAPDFVIVASPASFHVQHALPLIEHNIPVLIEKPVSTSIDDAVLLQEAASSGQSSVAVAYCLRYLPSAQIILEQLQHKKIGKLYNVDANVGQFLPQWRVDKDYRQSVSVSRELGGGALFELSHEVDYLQWLLGDMSVNFAHLRSSPELNLTVEDIADVFLISNSDVVCNMHLDFIQKDPHRRCRFIGSDGCLVWDLLNNCVTRNDAKGEHIVFSDKTYDRNHMYIDMLADFLRLIRGETNSCISIAEASKTVAIIDKIKNLAKRGDKA